ncbi:MAG: hypothetical protein NZ610_07895 [Candidatus Bipolaricaulota bacterium]|nr:hypothetical protein [Candidatus Bipolaricaulota bacterium]
MSEIVLHPSNWLYNAGVIGFLNSLERFEGKDPTAYLPNDGVAKIPRDLFTSLRCEDRYFDSDKKIASIVGKNVLYRNFLQPNQRELFKSFVRSLNLVTSGEICNLCGSGKWLPDHKIVDLNQQDPARRNDTKFLYRIRNFSIIHNSLLGPSLNEFPNAFWGLRQSATICHLCSFLIIHHHLALTSLSDGSEIFINAPSFKVMYYMNKFVREVFGAPSPTEARTKREILAMSVIEYAAKMRTTLGVWTGMNIEVVSRCGSKVEFFSLPYEVIQLLADRRIASLLSQIGEFAILDLVLDQDFSRLMELGYRLLRIGLKPSVERGESEDRFVKDTLRLEKNRQNPQRVAEQIFKLCAFVEDQRRRRCMHEHISFA